jgi:hypothetical protein
MRRPGATPTIAEEVSSRGGGAAGRLLAFCIIYYASLGGSGLGNRTTETAKASETRSLRANLAGNANFGNTARRAPVYPIVILMDRCVGELLPWSQPENIGPSL